MKVLASLLIAGTSLFVGASHADAATKFRNCAAMNRVYPHGVGLKKGLVNRGGKPVRYKVDPAVYTANKARDRDRDGIACEK